MSALLFCVFLFYAWGDPLFGGLEREIERMLPCRETNPWNPLLLDVPFQRFPLKRSPQVPKTRARMDQNYTAGFGPSFHLQGQAFWAYPIFYPHTPFLGLPPPPPRHTNKKKQTTTPPALSPPKKEKKKPTRPLEGALRESPWEVPACMRMPWTCQSGGSPSALGFWSCG